ncbi:ATP-binding protein [Deinococcus sp. HMF7604]|uniref:ATP-binding protein n=1 Tax=Deinococcus betulae TaxID=2873312 RepID=UPI001CCF1A2B|nr:ATP-binding protein [Deinococcus betulae]MBZ9751720.1 ATP-binding protein [Deinococcus betulae]
MTPDWLRRLQARFGRAVALVPAAEGGLLDFHLSPHLLRLLIDHQATSLPRAVAECVMNSVDAGAGRIDVTLHTDQHHRMHALTVQDDGRGFTTRQDVEQYFRTFGFDHDTDAERGRRQYGRFGIGRAQLWAFGAVQWRTGPFELGVNTQEHGVAFTLTADLPQQVGTQIHATLFKHAPTFTLQEHLEDHLRYVDVPLFLNGAQINQPPSQETWAFEDEDAYYDLRPGGGVHLYNLGVLIGEVDEKFAGGGVIVSKKALRLNLTRTRTIERDELGTRILATMHRLVLAHVKAQAKLSEGERAFLARAYLKGEVAWAEVQGLKLITTVDDRDHTLSAFANLVAQRGLVGAATRGEALADKASQHGLAVVLAERTLTRWGVSSVTGFKIALCRAILPNADVDEATVADQWDARDAAEQDFFEAIQHGVWAENLAQHVDDRVFRHAQIPRGEWTVEERAVLAGLQKIVPRAAQALRLRNGKRKVILGDSTGAQAWTDGRSFIALDRRLVPLAQRGLPGFTRLALLILHEMTHAQESLGSDVHDAAFYSAYHDASLTDVFGPAPQDALDVYVTRLLDKQLPLSRAALRTSSVQYRVRSLPDLLAQHGRRDRPWACTVRHHTWHGRVLIIHELRRTEERRWWGQASLVRGTLYAQDGACLGELVLTEEVDLAVWVEESPPKTLQPAPPIQLPKALSRAVQGRLRAYIQARTGPVQVHVSCKVDGSGPRFRVGLHIPSARDAYWSVTPTHLTAAPTLAAAERLAELAQVWLHAQGRAATPAEPEPSEAPHEPPRPDLAGVDTPPPLSTGVTA